MQYRNYSEKRDMGIYWVAGGVALVLGALALVYFLWPSSLKNTEWRLISVNGKAPLAESTLKFTDNRFSGTTLCRNTFGGTYTITADNKLDTGDVVLTKIACTNAAIRAQDTFFMHVLFNTPKFRVMNDRLEVFNASGQVVLLFAKK